MMIRHFTFSLFILFGFSNNAIAQLKFSQEIGVIAGPVAFRSDYGERQDSQTNQKNTGFGLALVHYLNFSYTGYGGYKPETYFNEHFKVRNELSYTKTDLQHYGKYVDKNDNSLEVEQLRAMRGEAEVISIGSAIEFYPFRIHDFESTDGSFAPFVSLGAQYSFYKPKAYSLLGPLDNPETTLPKYIGATTNNSGSTFSIVSSLGIRHKLSPLSDLMLDFRGQYFFSDWVDGLNPDANVYEENKANDWLIWLNVGYVYYLEY